MKPKYLEKRKYPRIEAKIKVSFQTLEDLRTEYTRNISAGGIFLKTNQLLDPNADIELTLFFPGNLGNVHIRGRVIRLITMTHPTDPDQQLYGVGIRFMDLDPSIKNQIEETIVDLQKNSESS
ncbi:MAG: PilZ domain-containing protein [Bdellovibrionales bacterium]|nr:PilZ domain-containing protein [Bdellovibrionales bacterium]